MRHEIDFKDLPDFDFLAVIKNAKAIYEEMHVMDAEEKHIVNIVNKQLLDDMKAYLGIED